MPNERITVDGNKLIISRSEDVQALIDDNARLASEAPKMFGDAAWRYAGRIPAVIAEQWSMECGARIGTAEFAEYVQRKLSDGDFAKFRIKGF